VEQNQVKIKVKNCANAYFCWVIWSSLSLSTANSLSFALHSDSNSFKHFSYETFWSNSLWSSCCIFSTASHIVNTVVLVYLFFTNTANYSIYCNPWIDELCELLTWDLFSTECLVNFRTSIFHSLMKRRKLSEKAFTTSRTWTSSVEDELNVCWRVHRFFFI